MIAGHVPTPMRCRFSDRHYVVTVVINL